jgi:hypothetical protein
MNRAAGQAAPSPDHPVSERPLRTAADHALAAFLSLTDSTLEAHAADRAVTLHCLSGHAPGFFSRHALQADLGAALAALGALPTDLGDDVPWEVAMARLDAQYFRALHGLELKPIDPLALQACVQRIQSTSAVTAWVLAELGVSLGVEVTIPEPEGLQGVERTYWRTHQLLFATSYLRDALDLESASHALDELQRSVMLRLVMGELDAGAEALFCLQAGGREVSSALLQQLASAQRADGCFVEAGVTDQREQAHTTAVCLIALARAAEAEGHA